MLQIRLFKTLRVIPEGGMPLDLGSPTTRSLMAYLALNRHHPLDRRHLAFVLWPLTSEVAARRNLRQYLHRLRGALVPVEHERSLLIASENTVQLSPGQDIWVDVEEFQKQAANGQGLELYEGDLLEDLYDDWIASERERLRAIYLSALQASVEAHRQAGRSSEAIAAAQQMIAADPLQEISHVALMKLYYAQGDRARALQQFKTCEQLLAQELGVTPLPETRAIYEAMAAGTFLSPARPADRVVIAPATPDHPQSPFIGRQAELEQLEQWLASLRDGRGRMVLIQGEPGVGKTRLVQEALRRASFHLLVLAGQGREFETIMPYHPLAEAIRRGYDQLARPVGQPPAWLSVVAQLAPEMARSLGASDLPPGSGAADRHQVAEALGSFFLAQAHREPTVLFIDDAHWADLPTWEFLAYVSRRCSSAALLVICAARMEDAPPEAARLARTLLRQQLAAVLNVPRLSSEETAQLVTRLGGASDEVVLRRVYEETGGNPFFAIETVRAMQDTQGAWTLPTDAAGRRPAFAVPLNVRTVIEARLDRMDAACRQLLCEAAALGRTFQLEQLQRITQAPPSTTIAALEEWMSRLLVRPVDPAAATLHYQFEHDLIRHVAYEQMSLPRRRWVHRRIAETLESETEAAAHNPAEIAYHFLQCDTPSRALPHLIAAGEQSLAMRSYQEARKFGLQAVGLLKQMPTAVDRREGQIDLNLQLALAYSYTSEMSHALPILQVTETLAESLGDRARLGRTQYRMAQVLWRLGRPGSAGEYARRAMRLAEQLGDGALLGGCLRMIGRVCIATSVFDDAITVLQEYLAQAPARHARPDLAIVHGYLGAAFARVGAWPRALEMAEAGVRYATETLSPSTLAAANMHLAFVHSERHDWAACLGAAQDSLPTCDETGFSPHCFMLHVLAGRALCQQGEFESGRGHIELALTWAHDNDYRIFVHLPYLFLVEALLGQEAKDKKESEARLYQAQSAIHQALDLARASADRWSEGVALRLRAEVESRQPSPDWTRVETDLVASRDVLRQIRARPDLARTYLSLRRLYDRAAQIAWAVDCHFRATSIFEELGMAEELRAAQGMAMTPTSVARPVPTGTFLKGPN